MEIIDKILEIRLAHLKNKGSYAPIQVYLTRSQTVKLINEIPLCPTFQSCNLEAMSKALDSEQTKPYFIGVCCGVDVYNICDTEIYGIKVSEKIAPII